MISVKASVRLAKAYAELFLMGCAVMARDGRGMAFKANHEMFTDPLIRRVPFFEESAYFGENLSLEISCGLEFDGEGATMHVRETDGQANELAAFLEDLAESELFARHGAILEMGNGAVSAIPSQKRDIGNVGPELLRGWPSVSPTDLIMGYHMWGFSGERRLIKPDWGYKET